MEQGGQMSLVLITSILGIIDAGSHCSVWRICRMCLAWHRQCLAKACGWLECLWGAWVVTRQWTYVYAVSVVLQSYNLDQDSTVFDAVQTQATVPAPNWVLLWSAFFCLFPNLLWLERLLKINSHSHREDYKGLLLIAEGVQAIHSAFLLSPDLTR